MIYVGKGGASAAPGRGVLGGVLTLLIGVSDTSYTCPDLALGGLPARLFFRCFYLLLGLCLSVFSWSFVIERVEISACRLDIFQPVEADVFDTTCSFHTRRKRLPFVFGWLRRFVRGTHGRGRKPRWYVTISFHLISLLSISY